MNTLRRSLREYFPTLCLLLSLPLLIPRRINSCPDSAVLCLLVCCDDGRALCPPQARCVKPARVPEKLEKGGWLLKSTGCFL